jgi:hypothetical protein
LWQATAPDDNTFSILDRVHGEGNHHLFPAGMVVIKVGCCNEFTLMMGSIAPYAAALNCNIKGRCLSVSPAKNIMRNFNITNMPSYINIHIQTAVPMLDWVSGKMDWQGMGEEYIASKN